MAKNKTNQTQRRFKYGINVTLSIVIALAIVVVINVIAYRRLAHLRKDLTATRLYSLSDQTRKVLQSLDKDYRIVTLISRSNEAIGKAKDLIAEYDHYSSHVAVEHINPTLQIGRVAQFYQTLLKRYDDQIEPLQKSVESGRAALDQLRNDIDAQKHVLSQILQNKQFTDEKLKQFVQSIAQAFSRFESQYEQATTQIDQTLASSLPDYSGAIGIVQSVLTAYDEKVFAVAIEHLKTTATSTTIHSTVQNQLLQLTDEFGQARRNLAGALGQLQSSPMSEEYSKLREQLNVSDTVVLVGDDQIRVVPLEKMFRLPQNAQQQQMAGGPQPEFQFLGEEKITGALIAMSLEHQPLVVFVQGGRQPVLGYQGQYEQVANRLRNMNFEVKDWSLGGKRNPMTGQPGPPSPPPTPAPGQKVVWIATPIEASPMMMQQGGGPSQKITAHIAQRLEQGDSVMVMLAPNPMAAMGMPDPMAKLISSWGINVQNDRVVMNEVMLRNRKTAGDPTMRINQWPQDLSITQAMAGTAGVFVSACPVDWKAAEGVTIYPLAQATGQRMWAHTNMRDQNPTYQEATAADVFTLAVAAQKTDGQRIAVFADPVWATDQIVNYGLLGAGTASMVGAMFPANAELFVNSVFWLSDLDQLIAASARTQDIRRIKAISAGQLTALRWGLILGMPLVVLLGGVGVWMTRRGN